MFDISQSGRWYEMGRREIVMLVVLMAFVWWQAVRSPVRAEGGGGERPPTSTEVVVRGVFASVLVVGVCIAGRLLVRRAVRVAAEPKSRESGL